MDIDDDVIDLSQVRDDFDLGYSKTNQSSFGNMNTNPPFQFNATNNNSLSFFQTGFDKNNVTNSNNGVNNNIQLPFNSMDDDSDTEILIPLTNENEELITDVQPSFSLEHGEEDATIEIELESYEKEKYSWFSKSSPFRSKIFNNNNNGGNNTNTNINNSFSNTLTNLNTTNTTSATTTTSTAASNINNIFNNSLNNSNNKTSFNFTTNMNISNNNTVSNNSFSSNLNTFDFNFSNNKRLSIPKSFQASSNTSLSSSLPSNTDNNNHNNNSSKNIFSGRHRLSNSFDKSRGFSLKDNGKNIENKSFIEIVEKISSLSQKEKELDLLSDKSMLKSDLNLKTKSPSKLDNSLKTNNSNSNTLNISNNNTTTNSMLDKYKFKLGSDNQFSTRINRPFSFGIKEDKNLLNNKSENENVVLSGSMLTSEINKIHEDITKTVIENNIDINSNIRDQSNMASNSPKATSHKDSLESEAKISHLSSLLSKGNSNDSGNGLSISNDKKQILESKSNSFSNDAMPSHSENKELESDKRRSLGSLNLTHFTLNHKTNDSINKRIEEIRERLKLNEKRQEQSEDKKSNIKNPSSIHFETKSEIKSEQNLSSTTEHNLSSKLNSENQSEHNLSSKLNIQDNISPKMTDSGENSDGTNELLNSSSFEQLEISSKDEKRPPTKKKPFSLDNFKDITNNSFSLNLNLSSNHSTSSGSSSSFHTSKQSSIPTFSQFYSNNKSQKESKKPKNTSLLNNIPKSQSPSAIEKQLSNPASMVRVAKYARLNNTKLPMPSKVPRKLYDEYLNLRGDLLNNIHDSSEIKPVEPRKQAIPISKLRQPSKLRLRPNILNTSIHNNHSTTNTN